MRIILFGPTGQVGWELSRSLAVLGDVMTVSREMVDLSNIGGLGRFIEQNDPKVVVNAAAYTAVDRAESEVELCHAVNVEAPQVMAEVASNLGALFVHYSSDYVFDGSGTVPWTEDATTAPLSVYGTAKCEGEQLIAAANARHLIFRTSWVYAARGGNFAKSMLRLAHERDHLTVVDDQWGAPTGADLIADVTAHAIRQTLNSDSHFGTYHLAASGETTWNGYARFVLDTARALKPSLAFNTTDIAPVPTSAFPTPARRPLNSRLDTTRLRQTFDLTMPHWQHGVRRMLAEIL